VGLFGDELVTKVLKACRWPTSGEGPLTPAEILALADDVIAGELWPDVVRSHGAYYAGALDYDITSGYARYRLPKRAAGPLYDVTIIDPSDTDRPDGRSAPMVMLEELGRSERLGPTESGYYHFIDGDFLGLWPQPDTTEYTLRIRYPRAPSTLCLQAQAREIVVDVDLDAGLLGAAGPDSVWSEGDTIDIVGAGNAHQVLVESFAIVAVTTFSVEVAALTNSGVALGDWIATAGTTPLVQLPDVMLSALIRRVAEAALEAADDAAGAEREGRAAHRLGEKAASILARR
jgi:hypothetical protein